MKIVVCCDGTGSAIVNAVKMMARNEEATVRETVSIEGLILFLDQNSVTMELVRVAGR